MKVEIRNSFKRDLSKIKDKFLLIKVKNTITQIKNSDNLSQIENKKKIVSEKGYYRIRVNDYRIGIKVEMDTSIFLRFLHRKDFYTYFP